MEKTDERIEEIRKTFTEMGFKEDKENKNRFVFEAVSYNVININGKTMKQEQKETLAIEYAGDGGSVDDSDVCMDDLMFFNIYKDDELAITLGVFSLQELIKIIGIK